jgi:hypothetical protein
MLCFHIPLNDLHYFTMTKKDPGSLGPNFCDPVPRTYVGIVGLAWLGLAWLGLAWLGLAWLGLAWLGLAWLGLAWLGLAWLVLFVVAGLASKMREFNSIQSAFIFIRWHATSYIVLLHRKCHAPSGTALHPSIHPSIQSLAHTAAIRCADPSNSSPP